MVEQIASMALVGVLAATVIDRPAFPSLRLPRLPIRWRRVGGITFIRVFNMQLSFCKTTKAF